MTRLTKPVSSDILADGRDVSVFERGGAFLVYVAGARDPSPYKTLALAKKRVDAVKSGAPSAEEVAAKVRSAREERKKMIEARSRRIR